MIIEQERFWTKFISVHKTWDQFFFSPVRIISGWIVEIVNPLRLKFEFARAIYIEETSFESAKTGK